MARRVGLALLVALALVLLLIAGVVGLAQTGYGKRIIADRLGDLLSTPEMAVEISGLQGTVPIDMRLGRITAADPDGIWLEIDDARLAWSPGALLRGRIWVDEVSAARIRLNRLPPSEPAARAGRAFPPPGAAGLAAADHAAAAVGGRAGSRPGGARAARQLHAARPPGHRRGRRLGERRLALERIDQPTASASSTPRCSWSRRPSIWR